MSGLSIPIRHRLSLNLETNKFLKPNYRPHLTPNTKQNAKLIPDQTECNVRQAFSLIVQDVLPVIILSKLINTTIQDMKESSYPRKYLHTWNRPRGKTYLIYQRDFQSYREHTTHHEEVQIWKLIEGVYTGGNPRYLHLKPQPKCPPAINSGEWFDWSRIE